MARRVALAGLAAVAALLVSGCGAVDHIESGDGDASNGKALFVKGCGTCHVMKDAGSKGAVGPNLDDAFDSARGQGFDESTIRDVVRGQIAYPEDPMPAKIYEGEEAVDVAAYVAECAGTASCGVQAAGAEQPPATTGGDTGDGGGGEVDGKSVFTGNCGGCHTLADAGTSGAVGPNLDEAKPAKDRVAEMVTNGGGGMPSFKGQLSEAEIDAVAKYVSESAGK